VGAHGTRGLGGRPLTERYEFVRQQAPTTDRRYAATVSEPGDRRALKKAQTRELIRSVAQRLFDESGFDTVTIADIARECDVAVQTVFNHFPTKEELFFDGHTPWVDTLADSVRQRDPGVAPLAALREHLVHTVGELIGSRRCPDRRRYIATLEASDALLAYRRELVHESERKLREALLEAWATSAVAPVDPESSAPVIAAIWVAAARSLVLEHQPLIADAAGATALADRVLRQLERGAMAVHGPVRSTPPSDTGWPQDVRRAG
jgi:AcrR family transcriptional regulator